MLHPHLVFLIAAYAITALLLLIEQLTLAARRRQAQAQVLRDQNLDEDTPPAY